MRVLMLLEHRENAHHERAVSSAAGADGVNPPIGRRFERLIVDLVGFVDCLFAHGTSRRGIEEPGVYRNASRSVVRICPTSLGQHAVTAEAVTPVDAG